MLNRGKYYRAEILMENEKSAEDRIRCLSGKSNVAEAEVSFKRQIYSRIILIIFQFHWDDDEDKNIWMRMGIRILR